MTIEFDDNGKFYTDIIAKTPVHVTIQTATHRIHGDIHVAKENRLKDELDMSEKFIAITGAIVIGNDGQVLAKPSFLAVRRDEIIWVMPDNGEVK